MLYTVGSLFAGVGGICLGFQNACTKQSKYKVLWANEIDTAACVTYRNNFIHELFEGDIKKILYPESIRDIDERKYYSKLHKRILSKKIDVLNGGFPCQAFSIAGERKGFDDERGNLFLNIIDLIEQFDQGVGKPRVIFLENVKNLKTHDHERTYTIIKSMLNKCGYTVFEKILNTMDYSDLPQNRERIYIIGFLNANDAEKFKLFNDNEINKRKVKKSNSKRIKDIKKIIDYNSTVDNLEKYYYTKEKYPRYFIEIDKFNNEDKCERINLEEQINEMYQFYQCRRGMYVRKNKSNVCPTLTANMGTGGHNVPLILVKDGIRKLTPKETFKLQGFPIDNGYILPTVLKGRNYPDSQLYKQAGNAVSVPIITMIARYILEILEQNDLK